MTNGKILGLHHVKVPVTDLARSRAWYERVFDLEPEVEFPDEDGTVRGVAYRAQEGFTLALRENPTVARAIAGYDPFAILLQGRADIEAWATRLDDLGVAHSPVIEATIGWLISFKDPDGLELRFYTADRRGSMS
ncbi:MAG: VOC family protein [Actinobacteria bacterium]|nr:VOC family protein [Actinomycetota bacterium]